jgi:hypothetical protein
VVNLPVSLVMPKTPKATFFGFLDLPDAPVLLKHVAMYLSMDSQPLLARSTHLPFGMTSRATKHPKH